MRDIIRQDFIVGPGGVIEIRSPELPAGSMAEVIVRLKKPAQGKRISDTATSAAAKNLDWPLGFLEQTFGSLRDSPLIRETQGDYEARVEIV
jgi:hypothetical protein